VRGGNARCIAMLQMVVECIQVRRVYWVLVMCIEVIEEQGAAALGRNAKVSITF
jgi:hypothetical protein